MVVEILIFFSQNLISPLVKADGSGVVLPYFFPEKLHSTDPLTGSQYWDPYCVRVLEVRKCPTLARNSSAVLLLGTCADKFPHVRFVCLDVNEVREYVINHGDMTEISAANILTQQVTCVTFFAICKPCQRVLRK